MRAKGTTLVFHGPIYDYCRRCAAQINKAFGGVTLRPIELLKGETFTCEGCHHDFVGVAKRPRRARKPVLERKS